MYPVFAPPWELGGWVTSLYRSHPNLVDVYIFYPWAICGGNFRFSLGFPYLAIGPYDRPPAYSIFGNKDGHRARIL